MQDTSVDPVLALTGLSESPEAKTDYFFPISSDTMRTQAAFYASVFPAGLNAELDELRYQRYLADLRLGVREKQKN